MGSRLGIVIDEAQATTQVLSKQPVLLKAPRIGGQSLNTDAIETSSITTTKHQAAKHQTTTSTLTFNGSPVSASTG